MWIPTSASNLSPKFLPATTSDESVHICSCMHRYFGSVDLSIYNKTINLFVKLTDNKNPFPSLPRKGIR